MWALSGAGQALSWGAHALAACKAVLSVQETMQAHNTMLAHNKMQAPSSAHSMATRSVRLAGQGVCAP